MEDENDPICRHAGWLPPWLLLGPDKVQGRSLDILERASERAPAEEGDDLSKDSDFIATTASVDRYGDIVEVHTLRTGPFVRNPVVLSDHFERDVVGRARLRKVRDGNNTVQAVTTRVRWDDAPVNPRGMLIAHQHRNDFRRAVSIGFLPDETVSRADLPEDDPRAVRDPNVSRWTAGYLFRKAELVEISSVGVPANRDALQQGYNAAHAGTDEALDRYLRETLPRDVATHLRTALREPEVRTAILAVVYGDATEHSRRTGAAAPPTFRNPWEG